MVARDLAAAAVAVLVLGLAGCGDGSSNRGDEPPGAPGASSPSASETWDLVVLSDSSGWGLGEAWAELIRRDVGVAVDVTDLSTGLQSGNGLLEHLRTVGDPQRAAVEEADVVSVWGSPTGLVWDSDANDCYLYPDRPRPPTRISRKDLQPYADLWRDILAEITALRHGQPTAIRARDIYTPVTSMHAEAGIADECATSARRMSAIIREEAERAGGTFVPVRRAFNGPEGLRDPRERGLLLDLEHLSEEGVALLAGLHHEAGYAELTSE